MDMNNVILSSAMMASSLSAMAQDFPYLTLETADGMKESISTASLSFYVQGSKLMAGSIELTPAILNKLHFSVYDETTLTTIK
jgi:hypothetical protein